MGHVCVVACDRLLPLLRFVDSDALRFFRLIGSFIGFAIDPLAVIELAPFGECNF